MGIELNFSDVEYPKYTPLPDGEYQLVLTDITVKPAAKDASKLVAHCTYQTQGNPDDTHNGRNIKYWQTLNDPANLGFTKIWLEALYGEPLSGELSLDETELIGRPVIAVIGQQVDQNDSEKVYNTIKRFVLPFETD